MRLAVRAGPGVAGTGQREERVGRKGPSTSTEQTTGGGSDLPKPRFERGRRRVRLGLLVLVIGSLGYYTVFVEAPTVRLHISHDDLARSASLSEVVYELYALDGNHEGPRGGVPKLRMSVFLDGSAKGETGGDARALPPRVEMPPTRLTRGAYELRVRFLRRGLPEETALEQQVRVRIDTEEDVLVFVPWPG